MINIKDWEEVCYYLKITIILHTTFSLDIKLYCSFSISVFTSSWTASALLSWKENKKGRHQQCHYSCSSSIRPSPYYYLNLVGWPAEAPILNFNPHVPCKKYHFICKHETKDKCFFLFFLFESFKSGRTKCFTI